MGPFQSCPQTPPTPLSGCETHPEQPSAHLQITLKAAAAQELAALWHAGEKQFGFTQDLLWDA